MLSVALVLVQAVRLMQPRQTAALLSQGRTNQVLMSWLLKTAAEAGLMPKDIYGGPRGAIAQLAGLADWFEHQREFCFYSSSVLIIYEGAATSADAAAVSIRLVMMLLPYRLLVIEQPTWKPHLLAQTIAQFGLQFQPAVVCHDSATLANVQLCNPCRWTLRTRFPAAGRWTRTLPLVCVRCCRRSGLSCPWTRTTA